MGLYQQKMQCSLIITLETGAENEYFSAYDPKTASARCMNSDFSEIFGVFKYSQVVSLSMRNVSLIISWFIASKMNIFGLRPETTVMQAWNSLKISVFSISFFNLIRSVTTCWLIISTFKILRSNVSPI